MTGNASVQNSAARSRTKLLRLAMVRVHRARMIVGVSRAAPDRSGRGRRPRASGVGPAGSAGSTPSASAAPAARRWWRHVTPCRGSSRRPRRPRVRRRGTIAGAPPAAPTGRVTCTARSWKRRPTSSSTVPDLQDPAVVHDRQPVAELLRLLHVVRRQEDRPAARLAGPAMSAHRRTAGRAGPARSSARRGRPARDR